MYFKLIHITLRLGFYLQSDQDDMPQGDINGV